MNAYLIGNLVGRLFISIVIVFIILLFMNRFKFKQSLKRMLKPIPIVCTLILFLLGVMGNALG